MALPTQCCPHCPWPPTYLCPLDLGLGELCSVAACCLCLRGLITPAGHGEADAGWQSPHIVSKKALVLAGYVHPRDAAKDTKRPNPGGTECAWHLAVGRGQAALTSGCAAVPLPEVGRGSRVEFPHQKGKLRHSATRLLLGTRPSQAALHTLQPPPRAENAVLPVDRTWAYAGAPGHAGLMWGCEKAFSPWWAHLGPVGGMMHIPLCQHYSSPCNAAEQGLSRVLALQRVGRGLSPKPRGWPVLPPSPTPGPTYQSLLLKRLGEYGGGKAMPPRDPVPAPLFPGAMLALPVAASPQLAVAKTAWVLAASRGSSHGVNMLGDDLSSTQLALSRPMASVPSRAARVPPSLGR